MPTIKCPVKGCKFTTEDVDIAIVVQLLQIHSTVEHRTLLPHHVFNNHSNSWKVQTSRPMPTLKLSVSVVESDYIDLGLVLKATATKVQSLPVMADTGCQCCLASMTMIQRLGLTENDLIPVFINKMYAANNGDINILGAAILRFSGTGGKQIGTRQVVYVTDNSADKMILSLEACISLGMITDSFPRVGEVLPTPTLTKPLYPFQCIYADHFEYHGRSFLVIVDRYSNWPIIEDINCHGGLINCLQRTFVTFEIPDEIASDGGPEFITPSIKQFLQSWGVRHHRLAFPCRTVTTIKRLICNNIGPRGELNTDTLERTILQQYRNTQDSETKISPTMCIYGPSWRRHTVCEKKKS